MPACVVLDTGVLYVAEGISDQAGPACVAECSRRLRALEVHGVVVLDDGGEIMEEYRKQGLHTKGKSQPRAGAHFLRWLIANQYNPRLVHRRPITNLGALDPRGYAEFPEHEDLTSFDSADRKFVATALSHEARPPILVSVDSDWAIAKGALKRQGVKVTELCPVDMASLVAEKGIQLEN